MAAGKKKFLPTVTGDSSLNSHRLFLWQQSISETMGLVGLSEVRVLHDMEEVKDLQHLDQTSFAGVPTRRHPL